MTIEQTIDVPANRRLILEIPPEIPVGKVILTFTPAQDDGPADALERDPPPEDETEFLLRPPNRDGLLQAAANVEKGQNLIFFDTLDDAVKAAEKTEDGFSP
jgi:hypothetical protein